MSHLSTSKGAATLTLALEVLFTSEFDMVMLLLSVYEVKSSNGIVGEKNLAEMAGSRRDGHREGDTCAQFTDIFGRCCLPSVTSVFRQ